MTYCCALRLKDGLVFVSDTRTNAGVDHISVFRKLYTFGIEGERFISIQTSGNLATTQAVISHLSNHLELRQEPNLYSVNTMFEIAELVGQTLRKVISDITADTDEHNNYSCSLLLGGQIKVQICNFIIFIFRVTLLMQQKTRRIFKLEKVNMASLY